MAPSIMYIKDGRKLWEKILYGYEDRSAHRK